MAKCTSGPPHLALFFGEWHSEIKKQSARRRPICPSCQQMIVDVQRTLLVPPKLEQNIYKNTAAKSSKRLLNFDEFCGIPIIAAGKFRNSPKKRGVGVGSPKEPSRGSCKDQKACAPRMCTARALPHPGDCRTSSHRGVQDGRRCGYGE